MPFFVVTAVKTSNLKQNIHVNASHGTETPMLFRMVSSGLLRRVALAKKY
jgi:hypothetical protein